MVQATKGCCRDHSRWMFFDLECCEIMIVRRKVMLLSRLHKGVSQTREKKKKKLSQDGWPSMSSPKTHSYVYTKLLMQTSKQPGRNDINRIFKGDSAGYVGSHQATQLCTCLRAVAPGRVRSWMSAVSPHATSVSFDDCKHLCFYPTFSKLHVSLPAVVHIIVRCRCTTR